MTKEIRLRQEKVKTFLARIVNDATAVAEIGENEHEPKRYLVGEYDSDNLVCWFWTAESLDEAEKDINNHEACTPRKFRVFDLDTDKEHRVTTLAQVQR